MTNNAHTKTNYLFLAIQFISIFTFSVITKAEISITELRNVFNISYEEATDEQLKQFLANEKNLTIVEAMLKKYRYGQEVRSFLDNKQSANLINVEKEAILYLAKKVVIEMLSATGIPFLSQLSPFIGALTTISKAPEIFTQYAENMEKKYCRDALFGNYFYWRKQRKDWTDSEVFQFLYEDPEGGFPDFKFCIEKVISATKWWRFWNLEVTEEDLKEVAAHLEFAYQSYLLATDVARREEVKQYILKNLSSQIQAQPGCVVTVWAGESIQKAIDRVSPGTVICLAEGTWEENLRIEKSLTLRGAGRERSVIKGKDEGKAIIWIYSNSEIQVTLEGLTITEPKYIRGVHIGGSAKVLIRDSQISRSRGDGIFITDQARVSLSNSSISGNDSSGLWVNSVLGLLFGSPQVELVATTVLGNKLYGVQVSSVLGAPQMKVENSTITQNGDVGLSVFGYLFGSPKVDLLESTISENGLWGLEVIGQAEVRIENSVISNNEAGMSLGGSAKVLLVSTTISKNKRGIDVNQSADASLKECIVSENRNLGISVQNSAKVSLQHCIVSRNGDLGGFHVFGSAKVTIESSSVFENDECGFLIGDASQVHLRETNISGNGRDGLSVLGSARVDLQKCTIENNKRSGVFVQDKSYVRISNSIIRNNALWGIAAALKKCGAIADLFTGNVYLINEIIYGNGKGGTCLP
jgi:parallel beta-helix repeat protein